MLNTENIKSLIGSGEDYNMEFKVRVPSKVHELTEEICAFPNADGGYLFIGVNDNVQIAGVSLENHKRSAVQDSINEISPALHCELYPISIENKTVWVIDIPSGKNKPYIFSGYIYVPTAKRYLNSLVKSGLIEFKGTQKTSGYHILIK